MQNQKHCKKASKLERREFRSLWDTEAYILIGLGFLPIKQGSQRVTEKKELGGPAAGWFIYIDVAHDN